MIIWLASYPKSGNTWLRSMIASYFYTNTGEFNFGLLNNIDQFPSFTHFRNYSDSFEKPESTSKYWLDAQIKINQDKKIKFFKTHNAFWKIGQDCFTNDENTKGIIHIVRDPRNVITSIKNHYGYENYKEALDFMKHENNIIGVKNSTKEEDLPTPISSWKLHYNSWKNPINLKSKYILIKYENLINNPYSEFSKIIKFIEKISEIKFKEKNILKSIENTKFENLQKQEEKEGFKESPNNNKFFYLGPKNNWQSLLDKNIKDDIETSFKNEMQDLGYL